ncbi:MAG TPA: hypothetical protein DCE42_29810 [Myxococcales bacterium]|nr:hypothetical protein [Myxococcales bacterium]
MENQSKISPKSWRGASWHLLLFLAILTAGIALPYTHAHAKKLQLQDLIVLKQVGYSDTQLVDEIKKSGMTGKFALTPKQVLKLRKEGFSIAIIRMMGIKKAVTSKPVSLSEMQRWLKQKKPTAWMRAQLTKRGIVKQQFGTFTILQLSRLGLPMSLLKLLHQLKQKKPGVRTKPTPPVRRQPPTPRPKDDPNKLLKDLPLVPSFPFEPPSPARRTPPQTRTKPTPSTNTKQPPKVTRWGTQRTHAAPLSPRKKRIANRKGTLVTLPANRVYTHIGHYYSLKIPKGWNVYEDVNPDGGDLDVYITPDAEPHIRRLKRGIAITISYLPHNDRFLLTRSLKQISLFALQEYLGSEPKVGEIKPLTATTFQKKKALDVLLEGKEQTHTNELRAKWTFVRHKNTIIQVAYFAKPSKFKAFAKQVDKHLSSFAFLDPLKHHRKKRLQREASVQSLIQKNTKSVVSISVLRKRKGKKSFVASGTGFVITKNGYVLTNHHVAINRTTGKPYSKYILNWDRSTGLKSVEARCVAAHFKYPQWRRSRTIDSKTGRISVKYILQHVDIALLKIKTPGTYQPVKLRPIKSAMLGDTVIAMGFPLEGSGIQNLGNEDITATTGRISRFVRMGDRMVNEIQHTAKVAGGNSGGPLLDVHTGGVIGINTWVGIFDKRLPRPAMGLGYYYALPINLAWQFFPDYVDYPQDKLTHLQWYELGSKWLSKGQYAPAKRAFLRVIKKKPSFIPAYAQLATLYTRRAHKYHNDKRDKYMKVARRWADRGLKRDLAHPRLMQLLAQITISQKEWMTTRYLISKMLKADPNKWSTYLLRAQMYNKQKKYNLALNDAYSVIELAGSLLPIGHSTRG